jgi:hypothetical protein
LPNASLSFGILAIKSRKESHLTNIVFFCLNEKISS